MKYKVMRNHCGCHPETCCCNEFVVIDADGEKVASSMDKSGLDKLVEQANRGEK
jgi:hypothetical protein